MIRGLRFTTKGGPGSGHHGHSGVPGKVGGSAPGGGSSIGVWGGIQAYPNPEEIIAEDAADFILNHTPGDKPSQLVSRYIDAIPLKEGQNLGEWAKETLVTLRPKLTYESGKSFLEESDLTKLQTIKDYSVWKNKRIVFVKPPERMPSVDPISVEREYGLSRYAIRPDVKATGTWNLQSGVFAIGISTASLNKRKTFWHEFSHTIPEHVISNKIGPSRPGESAAEYSNRFAIIMSE